VKLTGMTGHTNSKVQVSKWWTWHRNHPRMLKWPQIRDEGTRNQRKLFITGERTRPYIQIVRGVMATSRELQACRTILNLNQNTWIKTLWGGPTSLLVSSYIGNVICPLHVFFGFSFSARESQPNLYVFT
jgi:hypothetical protein